MSAEENKAIVRRVLEALYQGDLTVLDEHPGLEEIRATVEYAQRQQGERPTLTIEQLIAQDDCVAARTTWSGGSAGEGGMEAILLYQVADGKIVKQHSQVGPMGVIDPATRFSQTGSQQ